MNWQKIIYIFILSNSIFILKCQGFDKGFTLYPKLNGNAQVIDSSYRVGVEYFRKAEFDSAIHYLNKASFEANHLNDSLKFILCNLQLSECYLSTREFDNCFISIRKIQHYLKFIDFHNSIDKLNYYHILGRYYYRLQKTDSSNLYLNKAVSLNQTASKSDSLKVLLLKLKGNNYYAKNNLEQALEYYKKALSVEVLRTSDTTSIMASLYGNIGVIYSIKGMHLDAEVKLIQSIKIKEKLLDSLDPVLARSYENFGRLQMVGGELDNAVKYFNKAENIYVNKFGSESYYMSSLYFNKGAVYINKKDFEKALLYHMKSIEVYLKYIGKDNPILGKVYGNMGLIYRSLKKYNLAIEFYRKSLDIVTDPSSIPIGYRNLAHCYKSLGRNDSAIINFHRALDESITLIGLNNLQSGTSYLALGEFYEELGDKNKAYINLTKALEVFIRVYGEKDLEGSIAYYALGNHFQKRSNYFKALDYYQKSLVSFTDNYFDTNYRNNPDIKLLNIDYNTVLNLKEKSRVLLKLFSEVSKDNADLIASFKSSKLGIQLFEEIRKSLMTEDDKLFLTSDITNLYELSVISATILYDLTGDRNYLEEAFMLSEKSKASILLSSIKELEASNFSTIPDSLRKLEKSLKKSISITEHLLYEENSKLSPNDEKLKFWNNDLFFLHRKYERLISKLEKEYSDYYDLKYNFNVFSASKIKENIRDDILIEYFHADSILFAFYISADTIGYCKTIIINNYEQNVKDFIDITHNPPSTENSSVAFDTFTRISNELYVDLIQPLFPVISGKNLIIIPDGMLGYMPFEALITTLPKMGKADYRGLSYLIKDYTVRYSYSASLLFKNKRKKKTNGKLLAFAPSYEINNNLNQDTLNLASSSRDRLNPLDFNVDEVEGILDIVGGDINVGEAASVIAFKQNAEDYTILHLAMHALIDDDEPLASKLAFSSTSDQQEDGFLNAYEIYNMNLNAQMVVLSACQTGAGSLSRGEGIMSMARGFFYAGVPGIVMTLWEIEDESSLKIMLDFYNEINNKRSKDEALQIAKQNYFQSSPQLYAHPYYWAAYVQIGNNSAITFYSSNSQNVFIISIFIILVIGIIWVRKKRIAKRKV